MVQSGPPHRMATCTPVTWQGCNATARLQYDHDVAALSSGQLKDKELGRGVLSTQLALGTIRQVSDMG